MEASTERHQQADLGPLSGIISNFLGSLNSGIITMELDKQLLLRLKINQNDINKINLEVGQKFMEILLEAFTDSLYKYWFLDHILSFNGTSLSSENIIVFIVKD